jgi:DNA invertase Pin-like site-specific DNA recombinase
VAVYGYSRVSTQQQASEGESLAVQERQIKGYCMMQGLEEPQMFTEGGVSGSVPVGSRPQGKLLIGALRKGDVVVSAKLDRMFRDAADALNTIKHFKKQGISLVVIVT